MPKQARVKFELAKTINLGNYENAKVCIGIEVQTDTDNIESVYEKIRAEVTEKLEQEEMEWKQ